MPKTVLITGASRGIGLACALLFAQNGYNIAINFCNDTIAAQKALEAVRRTGASAELFRADVGDFASVKNMIAAVNKRFGKIDVLINNAAVSQFGLFVDLTEKDIDSLLNTNFKGAVFCAKEVLKDMLSRKSGTIVNISSVWGQTGGSCEVLYSATKAALIGLTKALAKETALSNVRINCVCPGVIETDMLNNLSDKDKAELAASTPLNRLGRPEEVAKAVFFLAEESSSFVTGQVLAVNGGFYV